MFKKLVIAIFVIVHCSFTMQEENPTSLTLSLWNQFSNKPENQYKNVEVDSVFAQQSIFKEYLAEKEELDINEWLDQKWITFAQKAGLKDDKGNLLSSKMLTAYSFNLIQKEFLALEKEEKGSFFKGHWGFNSGINDSFHTGVIFMFPKSYILRANSARVLQYSKNPSIKSYADNIVRWNRIIGNLLMYGGLGVALLSIIFIVSGYILRRS